MRILYWLPLLLPFTAFAQLGVCNLDSLVEKHPYRREIEKQVLLKSRSFKDSAMAYGNKLYNYREKHYYTTLAEARRESDSLNAIQERMQQFMDSISNEIPAFRQRKINQLRADIRLDCYTYASYRGIFLFQQKGVVYTSPDVKDYTNELVNFLQDKYLYTLVNGRLQRMGVP
ncbi:hypothetical protein [Xanthocytophaga flava]|uniref:hypothetical protein n=1 Tax=Xanthocytophaga flava TaxID=3048013 RepID=UPI0028D40090|nr:hypothetical protein [Xanthocytophaga flavus]MDJ1472567.1 hypothetical protein [Xanthocytophaga flavus]